MGSQRAFLKPRKAKVDVDSKVGTMELISAEAAAKTSINEQEGGSAKDGVTKSGVGWHCSVCDCFLKDSMTYLDHINGKKHQRKLGFSMRVERSTKNQMLDRLSQLAKDKERSEKKEEIVEETNFEEIVKAKDQDEAARKAEKARKRKEKKKQKQKREAQQQKQGINSQEQADEEEEEVEAEGIDPAMAAMMGFSGFGGGAKNR
jgi:U4/U6.U5 tri-snRNP component SNU23